MARDEFGTTERSDRVRLVANNEHNILWFLVKRALVPFNRTTGPTVAKRPRVKNGAKFVGDGLGNANDFVEDILGSRFTWIRRITAEDGNDRVVTHLVTTIVGTAKGIVV